MSAYEHLLHPVVLKERIPAAQPNRQRPRLLETLRYLVPPIFVCWHRKMSRPFTRNGETYRVCLRCGRHRQFDLREWKTKGNYYSPTAR